MNKHLNLTREVGNCSSRNQIWRPCQVSRECLGTQGTAVALPGPGHYEQDDGMEFTCGFGIWLEQLELFKLNLEKWKSWRCEKGCKDDWWKSWRGKEDQRALGPVLGEIHGCPETKSSKRGKRLSLQVFEQQNDILTPQGLLEDLLWLLWLWLHLRFVPVLSKTGPNARTGHQRTVFV